MPARWFARFGAALLSLTVVASAHAQTADGVGSGPAGPRDDGLDSALTAQDIERLSEFQRRFYQVAGRAWGIITPAFVLDGFFSEHRNMWTGGVHNFAYGVEFTTRIPDKYDLVVSLDWANFRTPDGYWLESNDPVADANWAENNLSLTTLDVAFHWFSNLNRQNTFQVYYGVGLGASLVLGKFRKYDLDSAACGLATVEQRNSRDPSVLRTCFDEQGDPTILRNADGSRQSPSFQSIPPVLPSISATIGFRYLIADKISASIEGGFRGLYFYGGLELGYFWEVTPKIR